MCAMTVAASASQARFSHNFSRCSRPARPPARARIATLLRVADGQDVGRTVHVHDAAHQAAAHRCAGRPVPPTRAVAHTSRALTRACAAAPPRPPAPPAELTKTPPEGISVGPKEDNLFVWELLMVGPPGTM
jgi:hypothetical protein